MRGKFLIRRHEDNKYYWHLMDGQGRIIGGSLASFDTEAEARASIAAVKKACDR